MTKRNNSRSKVNAGSAASGGIRHSSAVTGREVEHRRKIHPLRFPRLHESPREIAARMKRDHRGALIRKKTSSGAKSGPGALKGGPTGVGTVQG